MDAQEQPAYPTDEQMDELLALEEDDTEEIKAILRKRQQEREQPCNGQPNQRARGTP